MSLEIPTVLSVQIEYIAKRSGEKDKDRIMLSLLQRGIKIRLEELKKESMPVVLPAPTEVLSSRKPLHPVIHVRQKPGPKPKPKARDKEFVVTDSAPKMKHTRPGRPAATESKVTVGCICGTCGKPFQVEPQMCDDLRIAKKRTSIKPRCDKCGGNSDMLRKAGLTTG